MQGKLPRQKYRRFGWSLILLNGYANGIYSSRRIEKATRERADFMMIVAGDVPDFRTISDFRKRNLPALAKLFVQVLKLCERAGSVSLAGGVDAHHEFLGLMLGSPPPGVTLAVQALEKEGLIATRRAGITILNRKSIGKEIERNLPADAPEQARPARRRRGTKASGAIEIELKGGSWPGLPDKQIKPASGWPVRTVPFPSSCLIDA